jgi:hypothetical protein
MEVRMKIRCRNCGLWHETKNCPRYGPMFPEPGKTRADYAKMEQEIQNRVAADIIADHNGEENDEGPEVFPLKPRVYKKRKITS